MRWIWILDPNKTEMDPKHKLLSNLTMANEEVSVDKRI